ncbi:helix-turn-helix domain-containing protein [Shouchella shacheensis]|uniref:helix-turn-helix domain-containing protein n=1 Tax=Shouchella shacheensis TaxID=1649580 RepID=UPI0007401E1F|nr:helix-turn-helix transcriptional regulator [Shouchella shacheensis]
MFATRLKECRIQRGLTMKELGEALNMSPSTISGYETGNRMPDLSSLKQLADYFHVSTDYLIGRAPKNKQPFLYEETMSDEELEFLRESLAAFRKHRR